MSAPALNTGRLMTSSMAAHVLAPGATLTASAGDAVTL